MILLFGVVLAIPLVTVFSGMLVSEGLLGLSGLAAIHENGLVLRRLAQQTFVPWASIVSISAKQPAITANAIRQTVYTVTHKVSRKPLIITSLQEGDGAAALISEKSGVRIT